MQTWLLLLVVLLLSAGCGSDTTSITGNTGGQPAVSTSIVFEPFHNPYQNRVVSAQSGSKESHLDSIVSIRRLPVPIDLLRNPSTGQLALPEPPAGSPDMLRSAFRAANKLQGFSTGGRITIPLDGAIDLSTVNQGVLLVDTVKLEESRNGRQVNPFLPFTASFEDQDGQRLVLTPSLPLEPGRPHLVVLTAQAKDPSGNTLRSGPILDATKSKTSLVDGNGNSVVPGFTNSEAQALESIRRLMQPVWTVAEDVTGSPSKDIPLAFVFTTQPLFFALSSIRDRVSQPRPVPTITESYTTPAEIDAYFKTKLKVFPAGVAPHGNVGAIYVGTLPAPWYVSDDLDGPFTFDGREPQVKETRALEFLAILPKGAGPFPAILFQHGLGRTKADMSSLADEVCANGAAIIGVDLVLHGANRNDGQPDGFGFYNQSNLEMMRDNVRQSVANLFVLNRMVTSGNGNLDGLPGPELYPIPTGFIGNSDGAYIGGIYASMDSNNLTAVLAGGWARLLPGIQANKRLRSAFDQNLAEAGIAADSFESREYYFLAQTIMDDADSFNYLPYMGWGGLRGGKAGSALLQDMFEVIDADPSPKVVKAQSQAQARALGAWQVNPLQQWPGLSPIFAPMTLFGPGAEYQFRGGGHNWLLDPSEGPPNAQTTAAARNQALAFIFSSFIGGNGTVLDVFRGPDVPLGQD